MQRRLSHILGSSSHLSPNLFLTISAHITLMISHHVQNFPTCRYILILSASMGGRRAPALLCGRKWCGLNHVTLLLLPSPLFEKPNHGKLFVVGCHTTIDRKLSAPARRDPDENCRNNDELYGIQERSFVRPFHARFDDSDRWHGTVRTVGYPRYVKKNVLIFDATQCRFLTLAHEQQLQA